MTATLREPVSTAPLPSDPQIGSPGEAEDPAETVGGGRLAERRGLTADPSYCGRRSTFAQDLLGWSGALESRLVTFAEFCNQ